MSTSTLEIRLPTDQYRSMPIPGHSYKGKPSKIASCYVRASELPSDFEDWMDVNPRVPAKKGERKELAGRVAGRIVKTLQQNPELFALKNQGIYLLVDDAEHTKESGGAGFVNLRLTDKAKHGIVNGGHTYFAIRQVADEDEEQEALQNAWVRLHILESVDPENITELAEGLNRSLQVTDASLANLEGKFDRIKAAVTGKFGSEQIAYKMGEPGAVDIQEVLAYMAMLNLKLFKDEGKHPNTIFGQPAKVLADFTADLEDQEEYSAYEIMLPRLHEILVLWERVLEECAKHSQVHPRLGGLGKKKGKNVRARKPRPAIFAEGHEIERRVFVGLVYPIFAAFRANVSPKAWKKGKFEWIIDPEEILEATIDQLCDIVRTAYDDNRSDPAVVGKKQAAYLACYQVVLLRLARLGKLATAA